MNEQKSFNEWLQSNGKKREPDKIAYFGYFCYKLLHNWEKSNPNKDVSENDLSLLKCMKLLFFTVAVKSHKDGENVLLGLFDNWCAMPYGHIEKDVYDFMMKHRDHNFGGFKITTEKIELL